MKKILRIVVPVILAFFGLVWLVQHISWSELREALLQQSAWSIFIVVILIPLGVFFRALSWSLVFPETGKRPSVKILTYSFLAGISSGIIVPATSEIIRVLTVSRWANIPKPPVLQSVIAQRGLDLLIQIPLFFLSLYFLFGSKIKVSFQIEALLKIVFIGFLIALLLYFFRSEIKGHFPKFISWFSELIEQFKGFFRNPKLLFTFFIFVIVVRFKGALQYYVLAQCYPETADISLWTFFLFTIFTTAATTLIPTQGGLGPWHWAAAQVFMLFYISYEKALVIATSFHLISLVFGLLNGLPFLFYYFFRKKAVV